MKFIEPLVEYWPQDPGINGMWHQIAKATRISYDSKPRIIGTSVGGPVAITPDGIESTGKVETKPVYESDKDFVDRVILKPARDEQGKYNFNKMHGSCLEQGTVYLKIPEEDCDVLYFDNPFSVYWEESKVVYVTTNLRVLYENNRVDDLKYFCEPTKYHSKRYCFHVITDIGVTREWNRMRAFSVVEQSTRYVDFTKKSHGGGITFIKPQWISISCDELNKQAENCWWIDANDDFNSDLDIYLQHLLGDEDAYKRLRAKGWKPEQARQVLPLNTRTEAVYTGYKGDWEHFIALRGTKGASGKAHPNIRILADKLEELLNKETNDNS